MEEEMHCLALVIAFCTQFQPATQEDYVGAVIDYLIDQGCGFDGQQFTEAELEGAKTHFRDEVLAYSWNPEGSDEHDAKERHETKERTFHALDDINLDDVNKASHKEKDSHDLAPFSKLPLTHDDEKTIYKIISTLGEKNIIALLFEKSDLERKGRQISYLHPLRFLGVIFSNHHLRSSMREVKKSGFKWDGFMDGLVPRMKEESARDNLMRYVSSFSKYLDVDPDRVTYYLKGRDWDGLVRYLIAAT